MDCWGPTPTIWHTHSKICMLHCQQLSQIGVPSSFIPVQGAPLIRECKKDGQTLAMHGSLSESYRSDAGGVANHTLS
jgi:hypothetical protein